MQYKLYDTHHTNKWGFCSLWKSNAWIQLHSRKLKPFMYLYAFMQVCGLQAQVKVRPSKETSHRYLCCVPFPATLSTCQSPLPHEHLRDIINVYYRHHKYGLFCIFQFSINRDKYLKLTIILTFYRAKDKALWWFWELHLMYNPII